MTAMPTQRRSAPLDDGRTPPEHGRPLAGKVAFITGAARGQGRSHALTLARAGADICAVDICEDIDTVLYPMASPGELDSLVEEIESLGRRALGGRVDVRDEAALAHFVDRSVSELGGIDIVVANAGISTMGAPAGPAAQVVANTIAVNLIGVWNTLSIATAPMVAAGQGGAVVVVSSTAGLRAASSELSPGGHSYIASKHGVVGLMRSFARALGPHRIRVNSVHPTGVNTMMVTNEAAQVVLRAAYPPGARRRHLLPVGTVECEDVSRAILWLVSDSARYVTGVTLPIDAGFGAA